MYRMVKGFFRAIGRNKVLLKYSLLTNTAFGVALRATGDVIQQEIESKKLGKASKDWTRTSSQFWSLIFFDTLLIMSIFGVENIAASGVIIGPLNYYWYFYLDKAFPGRTVQTIAKKILLDQMIGATLYTFLFIVVVCLLEGKSMGASLDEFRQKFLYIYLVSFLLNSLTSYKSVKKFGSFDLKIDWLVWPPAQAINFYLVPSHFRMAFVNLILVGWNIFLSFAKHNVIFIEILWVWSYFKIFKIFSLFIGDLFVIDMPIDWKLFQAINDCKNVQYSVFLKVDCLIARNEWYNKNDSL